MSFQDAGVSWGLPSRDEVVSEWFRRRKKRAIPRHVTLVETVAKTRNRKTKQVVGLADIGTMQQYLQNLTF